MTQTKQPKTASKFTPGPWKVTPLVPYRIYSEEHGIIVEEVSAWSGGVGEANARLIAQAPEMYELLDKLADRTRGEDAVLDIGRSEWANLCQEARRIKAEIDGVE